jgi:DNA (cytosine-5)-methyltransferase 1
MNKLKLLDLFSGIGGFSLGLESTGYFQTIAFVEKDKFCRQVLQKNFNNIPIEEDIRNVRGSNYAADVITGGFPCQPFSVAGKRKGTADDRYLWDETIRVVAECKPRWFIGENVEGLININNGMVLRQVQTDLEEQGFQVQCIVIPASGIGAWHQRKRIWIVAYSYNNGSYRSQRNETEQSSNKQEDRLSFRDDKDVPNSNTSLRGGRGAEFQSRDDGQWGFYSKEEEQTRNDIRSKIIGCDAVLGETTIQHSNNQRCEKSNISKESNKQDIHSGEFDSTRTDKTWWQTQSEFCGVPNGISFELDKDRANRIKSLGNSIVPQIARQIGLSIMKAELN